MKLRLFPILVAVATASFLLKAGAVWQGVGALAEAKPTAAESRAAGASPAGTAAGEGAQPGPALPSDPFALTDEEIDLLQMLAKRRAKIDERAAGLKQRETLLEAAEKRIDEKIAKLQLLQKAIEGLLVRRDEQEEAQLTSLVKIYENMKPKDAARIFEELDMAVLLDVIERMKERKTAPILAQMNPQRAKAITLKLAQRRGMPGKKK